MYHARDERSLGELHGLVAGVRGVTSPPAAPVARQGVERVPDQFLVDLAYKVGETFASRVALVGLGIATSVVVARILGPAGRGLYAVASAMAVIGMQFGNLGLHSANAYRSAREPEILPALTGNSLVASIAAGGVSATVAGVVFLVRPNWVPIEGALLLFCFAWIPFGLAYLLFQNLLLGINEVRAVNLIEVASRAVGVALIGLVLLAGRVSVTTTFAAMFLSVVFAFFCAARRLWAALDAPPRVSAQLFREGVSYGFKAYLASLFAYLVVRSDLFLVNAMLGAEPAGYYSAAVSIADLLYMFPASVGTILFPKLATLTDDGERWARTRLLALVVGGVMIVLGVVAVLVRHPLVELLFGARFLPAAPVVAILAAAMIFYGVNAVISACLAAMSFPWFSVWVWGVAAAGNVLLNIWWIPAYGIAGAAWASFVAYGAVLAAQTVYLCAVVHPSR